MIFCPLFQCLPIKNITNAELLWSHSHISLYVPVKHTCSVFHLGAQHKMIPYFPEDNIPWRKTHSKACSINSHCLFSFQDSEDFLIPFNLPRLIVISTFREICNISKTRKNSERIDCDFSLYPPLANKPVKNTFIGNKNIIFSVVRDIYFILLLYWQPLLTSSLALNFLWRICDTRIWKFKWWFCSCLTSHQCLSHQFLQSELWKASFWGVVLNIKKGVLSLCSFFYH